MIESYSLFKTQILLLCLIFVGVVTAKVRMIDEHARSSLNDLILSVLLPCSILSAFFDTDRSQLPSLGIILTISLVVLAFSYILSNVFFRKAGPEQKKVFIYATLISNAALLGTPVVESIYGPESLTYVAAYLLPLRVALWTFGIAVFTGGKGNIKKAVFHPCLIATYLGLLVMILGINAPALVSKLVFSLGNCTTVFSMIVVGNILAQVNPKKILTRLTVYFTFIRLILIPLLVMGICFVARLDPIITGISVILSGMPAGVTTSMLAEKYNGDRELASSIIFVSTLLSIISAPLLAALVNKL